MPVRTFRVFVSSTFSDLQDERNALQTYVFPRLDELSAAHGSRFQAIDLRWGIREEAGRDHNTLRICLEELARCQAASPRLNFLVLLGERYGWEPLPEEIPATEHASIVARIAGEREAFDNLVRPFGCTGAEEILRAWYRRDDNAFPPTYVLQSRAGEYARTELWERKVERPLRRLLGASTGDLDRAARLRYQASATHLEIVHGALAASGTAEHVHAFFREIENLDSLVADLPRIPLAGAFVDRDEEGGFDRSAHDRLRALRMQLEHGLPGNTHHYAARWTGGAVTAHHIGSLPSRLDECLALLDGDPERPSLCIDVWKVLASIVVAEASAGPPRDPLDLEIEAHRHTASRLSRDFIGRERVLETIAGYLTAGQPGPIAITGAVGTGKSATIATAVEDADRRHSNAARIYRFCGQTLPSSNTRQLLAGLTRQIMRAYGAGEFDEPADDHALVRAFHERLALAAPEKPLLLFIDAIDQLDEFGALRAAFWIPAELPPCVRLVVSCLSDVDDRLEALTRKVPTDTLLRLDDLSRDVGAEIVGRFLQRSGRRLQNSQAEHVLDRFAGCGRPLYLMLALEEAKHWRSYEGVPPYRDGSGLAVDIPGILSDMLWRLSRPENHGEVLVARSLGYLAAAHHGLHETEMLDILTSDVRVFDDFLGHAHHTPPARRLPIVVWSRLRHDLSPYLAERPHDDTVLLGFDHAQVRVAVDSLLEDNFREGRHRLLADYFGGQALFRQADGHTSANLRKMSELPFQLAHARAWIPLCETLTDFEFLRAKCVYAGAGVSTNPRHRGVFFLQRDLDLAIERLSSAHRLPQRWADAPTALAYLRRSLELSAHHLQRHPQLLLQEVLGATRTMGGVPFALAECLARGAQLEVARGESLVERICEPSSDARALRRTVDVGGSPTACDLHPTKRILAVSSGDRIVLWDVETAEILQELRGHGNRVTRCRFAPAGDFLVSTSVDKTAIVWDLDRGCPSMTLQGHEADVTCCDVSPFGDRIITGSEDWTARIWNAASGRCEHVLEGHDAWVTSCRFHPRQEQVATGSFDRTVRLLSTTTGAQIEHLELPTPTGSGWKAVRGYEGPKRFRDVVEELAWVPDGKRLVAATTRGELVVWDDRSKEPVVLATQGGSLVSCAVDPERTAVFAGGERGTLCAWMPGEREPAVMIRAHRQPIREIAVRRGHPELVTCGAEGRVQLWDRARLLTTRPAPTHRRAVRALALRGGRCISTCDEGIAILWHVATGTPERVLEAHRAPISGCAMDASGRLAVTCDEEGWVNVWSLDDASSLPASFRLHAPALCCDLSPAGTYVACGDLYGGIHILRTGDLSRVVDLEISDSIRSCSFLDDHLMLNVGDGKVLLYSVTNIEQKRRSGRMRAESSLLVRLEAAARGTSRPIPLATGISCVSVSGPRAIACGRGYLHFVRARPFRLHTVALDLKHPTQCCLANSGTLVAIAEGSSVAICDPRLPSEALRVTAHHDRITRCAFLADDRLLASADAGGEVRLWDIPSGREAGLFLADGCINTLVADADRATSLAVGVENGDVIFLNRMKGSGA